MRKASLLLTVVQNHFGKLGERINISRHIKPLAHKCIVYIRRTKLNDAKDSNQLKKYIDRAFFGKETKKCRARTATIHCFLTAESLLFYKK